MKKDISGMTQLAGVIANPIKHSLSPLIHNTAFSILGIDAVYLALEVTETNIQTTFDSVSALNMLGANVSMPYKGEAYDFVDRHSEEAKLTGVVNTIVPHNGKMIGYNTDGIGFIRSLLDKQVNVKDKKVTVLGAGGAAKAIVAQMALSEVNKITVFKRQNETFQETQQMFLGIGQQTGVSIDVLPYEEASLMKQIIHQSDIVVNSTNIGMGETSLACPILDMSWLKHQPVVVDLIYYPEKTLFLMEAEAMGCLVINGLGMLLHQAAASFQLWTNQPMPVKEVEKVLLEKLRKGE